MAGESEGESSSSTPEWVSFDDDENPRVAPAAGTYGTTTATSAGLLPAPPDHDVGSLPFSVSITDSSAYISKMQRRLDLLKQPGNVSITTRVSPRTATASRAQTIGTVDDDDDDDDFNPRSHSEDTVSATIDAGGVNSGRSCCCCWPWARNSYAAADTARTDALSEIDDLLPKAVQPSSQGDGGEIPLDDVPYVQLLNDSEDGTGASGGLALSDDWIEPEPEPRLEPPATRALPSAIEAN